MSQKENKTSQPDITGLLEAKFAKYYESLNSSVSEQPEIKTEVKPEVPKKTLFGNLKNARDHLNEVKKGLTIAAIGTGVIVGIDLAHRKFESQSQFLSSGEVGVTLEIVGKVDPIKGGQTFKALESGIKTGFDTMEKFAKTKAEFTSTDSTPPSREKKVKVITEANIETINRQDKGLSNRNKILSSLAGNVSSEKLGILTQGIEANINSEKRRNIIDFGALGIGGAAVIEAISKSKRRTKEEVRNSDQNKNIEPIKSPFGLSTVEAKLAFLSNEIENKTKELKEFKPTFKKIISRLEESYSSELSEDRKQIIDYAHRFVSSLYLELKKYGSTESSKYLKEVAVGIEKMVFNNSKTMIMNLEQFDDYLSSKKGLITSGISKETFDNAQNAARKALFKK